MLVEGGLEGDAAAFGVGEGSAGGLMRLEGGGDAVVGVGVDAVVDIGEVEAFGLIRGRRGGGWAEPSRFGRSCPRGSWRRRRRRGC